MCLPELLILQLVNCRIGSLEKAVVPSPAFIRVNCRIGSLETEKRDVVQNICVNCRIGSLEKY